MPNPKLKLAAVMIYIPEELKTKLERRARENERSISAEIRKLLKDAVR